VQSRVLCEKHSFYVVQTKKAHSHLQIQDRLEGGIFGALKVTTAVLAAITYHPSCGNGECETDEANLEGAVTCAADCDSLAWCPLAPSSTEVGTANETCAGIGTCHPSERLCSCPVGYTGQACTLCEFGFVTRGALHVP
jgi:Laminin EGF domain